MSKTEVQKNMTLRLEESLAKNVETVASVDGRTVSDVIRNAVAEFVEMRRKDPEFQKRLKENLEKNAELLRMLAEG